MSSERYFVKDHRGQISGPFSSATLKKLASEHKLDLSWQISTDRIHWCIAAKVKNLSASLEGALAANLSTNSQYRSLSHQEVVALFLDKFVLNNENFKDSFPFLQVVRTWWAKITLPKDFVITEVTAAGVHHIKYNLTTGETNEIDQREASTKVSEGVRSFNWFTALASVLALIWLVSITKDFVTQFSLTWGTLKTILFAGIALAGFIYKTKHSKVFVGYDLDEGAVQRLKEIAEAVAVLRACSQVWMFRRQENEGKLEWKYNAGDTFKVAKLPVAIFNRSIPNVETNIRVYGITYHSRAIYFLPEKVLIIDGSTVKQVPYSEFQVEVDALEYVESEGHVYQDSKVIAHRWRFINRDGSQDKRFKENMQLPVLRCGILALSVGESPLKMMTTSPDAPELFREKLMGLKTRQKGRDPAIAAAPAVHFPVATSKEKIPEAIPVYAVAATRLEKACPFCGEQILAVARKCKHCGEMLETA